MEVAVRNISSKHSQEDMKVREQLISEERTNNKNKKHTNSSYVVQRSIKFTKTVFLVPSLRT